MEYDVVRATMAILAQIRVYGDFEAPQRASEEVSTPERYLIDSMGGRRTARSAQLVRRGLVRRGVWCWWRLRALRRPSSERANDGARGQGGDRSGRGCPLGRGGAACRTASASAARKASIGSGARAPSRGCPKNDTTSEIGDTTLIFVSHRRYATCSHHVRLRLIFGGATLRKQVCT